MTPEWFYNLMVKLGLAEQRVGRFRGKQTGWLERLAESAFLSKRHIDWSKTRAYSQGNFGQIFVNQKGRQPQGCVEPEDVRPLLDDLKAGLLAIPHPETGEPLVEKVYERDELYDGPHAHLAPDLTVVLRDWRYRTIGLHDFTTNKLISPVVRPDRRPPDGGRPDRLRPGRPAGREPRRAANLLDIAPTVLHLLGVPVPADMDGRVLAELFDPAVVPPPAPADGAERRARRRRAGRRRLHRGRRRRDPAAAGRPGLSLIGELVRGSVQGSRPGSPKRTGRQFLDGLAEGLLPLGVDGQEVGVLGGEPAVAA